MPVTCQELGQVLGSRTLVILWVKGRDRFRNTHYSTACSAVGIWGKAQWAVQSERTCLSSFCSKPSCTALPPSIQKLEARSQISTRLQEVQEVAVIFRLKGQSATTGGINWHLLGDFQRRKACGPPCREQSPGDNAPSPNKANEPGFLTLLSWGVYSAQMSSIRMIWLLEATIFLFL